MLLQVVGNVVLILAIIIFNIVCMSKTRTLYVKPQETKIESTVESTETSIEETSIEETSNEEQSSEESTDISSGKIEEQINQEVSSQSDINDSKDIIDLQVEKSVLSQEEKYEINNFRQAMIIENRINFDSDTGKVNEEQKEDKKVASMESSTSKLRKLEEPLTTYIQKALTQKQRYQDKFCIVDIQGRDTLVIGDSRAVGIGNAETNVDIIAFSGIYDDELVNLLQNVQEKYNRIIIVASINNVVKDYIGNAGISQETINGISDIVTVSNKHLNLGGTTYYVKNTLGSKYAFLHYTLQQLNDNLKLNSGGNWRVLEPSYTILDSSSSDGLHFANVGEYREFFTSILDAIDKMEKRG